MGDLLIHASRVALDQCRHRLGWDDVDDYYTLVSSLTQCSNLEACFLTGITMVFEETHGPQPCLDDLACTADGGTIWRPIWSPYYSIGIMAMPVMTPLQGGT